MNSDLQDAVTLSKELARTPVQMAAKRVYDALCEAERHVMQLEELDRELTCLPGLYSNLDSLFVGLELLMHEGDIK